MNFVKKKKVFFFTKKELYEERLQNFRKVFLMFYYKVVWHKFVAPPIHSVLHKVIHWTLLEMCFCRRVQEKCLSLQLLQVYRCLHLKWVCIPFLRKIFWLFEVCAVSFTWYKWKLRQWDPRREASRRELHSIGQYLVHSFSAMGN